MNTFNFRKMTNILLVLLGMLTMNCGDKEKSVENEIVSTEKKMEQGVAKQDPEDSYFIEQDPAVDEKSSVPKISEVSPGPKNKTTAAPGKIGTTKPVAMNNKKRTGESTDALVTDHSEWDELLKRHVDDAGNVNYKKFKNDMAALEAYLDYLSRNAPVDPTDKNEKLAYYINLYNAATVKLILDNYPLKSIKDITSPWDKKWVQVGDEVLSLGQIEHKILRKMNDPRIHFAINCASYSCPKLVNEAFTASEMESQLQEATTDFINDPGRNQITPSRLALSNIFKWYKKDFTDNGSLVDYINPYTQTSIEENAKIDFLEYDWGLNDVN